MWLKKLFKGNLSIKNLENSTVTIVKKVDVLNVIFGQSRSFPIQGMDKKKFTDSEKQFLVGKNFLPDISLPRIFSILGKEDDKANNHVQEEFNSIDDALFKFNKLIFIGGPGFGKSFELRKYAENILLDIDDPRIPIFRSLRNFSSLEKLESFIGVPYQNFYNIVLILDGIDEVANVQDFISKLEVFLESAEYTSTIFQVIISCRTNIFNSSIKKIEGFEEIYLNELKVDVGLDYLNILVKNQLGKGLFEIEIQKKIDEGYGHLFSQFLTTPYLIKILANYISDKRSFEFNVADLWKHYTSKRLKEDSDTKFARKEIDSLLLEQKSKELSLLNELRKLKVISDSELNRLFGNSAEFKIFKHNSLMYYDSINGNWAFEHANIQEFFAAQMLIETAPDLAIAFIQVKNTGKTHPSLFNTIGFLTNLIDPNNPNDKVFLNWILDNEPDIIIQSDHTKWSDEVRVLAFKNIFEKECLKDMLWLGKSKNYTIPQMADFAFCDENFEYLLKFFNDISNPYRARYSALEVIKHMPLSAKYQDNFVQILKHNLMLDNLEYPIKALIISTISRIPFLLMDDKLINLIFDKFGDWDNNSFRRNLLDLIMLRDEANIYHDIIYSEFLLSHDIIKRKDQSDEVLRGNALLCQELVLSWHNSDQFLKVAITCFDTLRRFGSFRFENFVPKLVDRCDFFQDIEGDFILKLVGGIIKEHGSSSVSLDKNIIGLIKKNNLATKIYDYLIVEKKFDFDENKHVFGKIVNNQNLGFFIEKISKLKLSFDSIEKFRNIISHNDNGYQTALKFEGIMKDKGVVFKEEFKDEIARTAEYNSFKLKVRQNLETLFDLDKLEKGILKIFERESKNEISFSEVIELENQWYKQNSHGAYNPDVYLKVLEIILRIKKDEIIISDIRKYVTMGDIILLALEDLTRRIPETKRKQIIGAGLLEKINNEIQKFSETIDFDDVIKLESVDRFYHSDSNNLKKIDTLFSLTKIIDCELTDNFYLNCIEYVGIIKSGMGQDAYGQFGEIEKLVNNPNLINERVERNILKKKLFSIPLGIHVSHAIKNALKKTYGKIENVLLSNSVPYITDEELKLYVGLTKDYGILKKCCIDYNHRIYWSALKIILELKIDREFSISRAIEYLDNDVNGVFNISAINILLAANHAKGIEYIISLSRKDLSVPSLGSYENYDAVNNITQIKQLYYLAYSTKNTQSNTYYLRQFFETLARNISQSGESNYQNLIAVLNEIRYELESTAQDIFYISHLLIDCEDSFINSISKPYSFNEAKTKIAELL